MDIFKSILNSVPLFRHCTHGEISHLLTIAQSVMIPRGHSLDLTKIRSFNVVISGMFEIEALGNTDMMYFAPGSFFGVLPFTSNMHRGRVKAVTDSTLLQFQSEDIVKFFLMYYKALRGYLRAVESMGFNISDVSRVYFGEQKKVVSVYSERKRSGRSLFASMLGTALQGSGKTIILDMSYSGNSIFSIFEKKVTSALSHKLMNGPSVDELVKDRIEKVDDALDLINVSFGSKVKVEPDIISPLLCVLSRDYTYIIIDISNADRELRDKAFSLSDIVFSVVNNKKELEKLHGVFDVTLNESQRIYYILNEYTAGTVRDFSGGYVFESYRFNGETPLYEQIRNIIREKESSFNNFLTLVSAKRKALVLESLNFDAVFFSGFLSNLAAGDLQYDIMYSSSLSFVMLALLHVSADVNDFKKKIVSFFSEDKINRLLDITFPDEYVFKKNLIEKYAMELCGNTRLEMFTSMPVALLCRDHDQGKELFSTGYLKEVFAASFSMSPVFESVKIGGKAYSSGFPHACAAVEDLFRTDAQEITYVAVQNSEVLSLKKGRILPFYQKFVHYFENSSRSEKINMLANKSYIINVAAKDLDLKKIISSTEESTSDFFK